MGPGWGAESFLAASNDNPANAPTDPLLDDSPVATFVPALARPGINWSGPTQKPYDMTMKVAGNQLGAEWPRNLSMLGAEPRRFAPQLRVHGISVNFERTRDARVVTRRADGKPTIGLQSDAART